MIIMDETCQRQAPLNLTPTRVLWILALALSFLLSVLAAFRGGYVGPDYNRNIAHILDSTRIFDFSMPDPPLYTFLAHSLFKLIGRSNAFPITLAIIQAAVNTVALWWFFRYTERRFRWPLLHLALVFLLTFLPVRMIHAVSIGTDWMTIPVFVLVTYLFQRLLSEKTFTLKTAILLGLALALGIWSKYTFLALLPASFFVFTFLWLKRAWTFQRVVTICALTLVLPSMLILYSYWQSTHLKDAAARNVWLPKGWTADMNYKDLFSLKANDLQLFKAPEYFKKEILAAHRHSYLGLVHLGVFTDTMNLFQYLTVPQRIESPLIPDQKARRPWKTPVMVASMSLGVLWTLCALIGTPWALFRAARGLWKTRPKREDSFLLLGTAFFLLIFLPIPLVHGGAMFGFWTPRLILPSLLCFSLAAFLFIDRILERGSGKVAVTVMALVLVQCGLHIVMLK